MLSVKQLAEELGVCERTVRRMVKDGEIPYHKIGSSYRFVLEEVIDATRRSAPKPARRGQYTKLPLRHF